MSYGHDGFPYTFPIWWIRRPFEVTSSVVATMTVLSAITMALDVTSSVKGALAVEASIGKGYAVPAKDIGAAATDRASTRRPGYTYIVLDNPVLNGGYITSIEIWAATNLVGCKVGTFYGTAPNFICRDYATIGAVTAGSKQTSTGLTIEVQAGDYIGIYYSAGTIEAVTSGGAGIYAKEDDQFSEGEQTYTLSAGHVISLYGSCAAGDTHIVEASVGQQFTVTGSVSQPLSVTADVEEQ